MNRCKGGNEIATIQGRSVHRGLRPIGTSNRLGYSDEGIKINMYSQASSIYNMDTDRIVIIEDGQILAMALLIFLWVHKDAKHRPSMRSFQIFLSMNACP